MAGVAEADGLGAGETAWLKGQGGPVVAADGELATSEVDVEDLTGGAVGDVGTGRSVGADEADAVTGMQVLAAAGGLIEDLD